MSQSNRPLMTKRAYYVWSGDVKFKILARTEWEAALLVFQRLGSDNHTGEEYTTDPYNVRVNQKGFDSPHTAQFPIERILKAAGYTK